MAKKYDAILLYSDDIWNNNREGDFSDAEIIMKGKASETNCETYFPCGLYYELSATDDLGYQCLDISSDDKKYGFEVVTIILLSPEGRKIPLEYPTNSRQYPVTFGGKDGQAVSFFVDGVETYRSSKNAKVKAKKFIEERIEKLRSCAAPFAAESMEMGMEEMASEFSVERINPTPVSGKADMKAESFGAEENLAVADVDIHDGMNIPAGSGAIIGQAIPETDFTPFGASAEDAPVPADPRVSPLKTGLHTRSDTPEMSAEENLAIQDVEIWDGMVLPEGTGNVMGQMTPTTDFTPFGVSAEQAADPMPNESAIVGQTSDGTPYTRFGYAAESYMEETFKPDGMGEVVGAITAETDFTPFGASAEGNIGECPKCGKSDLVIQYYGTSRFSQYQGKGDFGCQNCGHQWFEPQEMEAEAFGGDLASLNDFNGVESVRVEAPLGHGVTENLGAEEMDTYGGLMGVAAAFIGGMAFSHWSKGKTSGDNAPDSETPSEESDDAPQA